MSIFFIVLDLALELGEGLVEAYFFYMGNKLGRKRQLVDEKYTRPQGLYTHKDVDQKKLRKLILESKLAPCYPGDDECTCDLEECPICFLYYPSLNRSRCCMKSICTECFLQMKVPNSTRPTQCPFCKTSNYAVEYRGVKTKEEKGLEQIEEQRVIEAKIRIRQKELQDDDEKDQKRPEYSSSSRNMAPVDIEYSSMAAPVEDEEILCFQDSCATPVRPPPPPPHHRANRDDEFDLDLEDIMIMEAIWLSIQEKGRHKDPTHNGVAPDDRYVAKSRYVCPATVQLGGSSASPSGGLACAIAALAEHQQTGGESSTNLSIEDSSSFNLLQSGGSRFYSRMNSSDESYRLAQSSIDALPSSSMTLTRNDGEWNVDRGSDVAEAGTSYAGSDGPEDTGAITTAMSGPDELEGNMRATTEAIIPESFEEQMMLAMAVSLAEARAMTGASGVSWQ